MTRDFLKNLDLGEGAKLPDAAVEAIMAEHGRTKPDLEHQITTLTTERDTLQTQLDAANDTIESYKDMDIEGIKQSAANWEQKYNSDTQTLRDQLAEANYGFAVKEATAEMKFSSESARKAFIAELTARKLPLQEGKLLGLDDFTNSFRESDPAAFAPEGETKTPIAVKGGGGGIKLGKDTEAAGGYAKASGGKDINFMIIHKPAVIQFAKHVAPKIIDPSVNQNADAYKFGYRKVGIADAYENKVAGIYLHHKDT